MASTSSNTLQSKYDVFLSFRGKDTRRGFISHLEKALRQNQIGVFIDKQLSGGEEIASALWGKIEVSKISLVVFSKNYADSPWCLDELVKIVECKDRLEQMVLPVFYEVDPTDVQNLTGSFGDAIAKHQKEFGPDRVDGWSNALKVIANLRGWDSRNFESDSVLIEEIVGDILKKLELIFMSSYDFPGLVGIKSRIKEVGSLLCLGSTEVCIVGIWGMGGIGKTTIAGTLFNQISNQFEGRCFMLNVREELEKRRRDALINEIYCKVLEKKELNTDGTITPPPIKNMLQKRKVLVVLDDLGRSHRDFLSQLVADLSCPGSRIIVTSRDKQVIEYESGKLYEVKGLNKEEARQLFCLHAFKRNYDPTEEHALLGCAVDYGQGNPLALKILGSNLCNKSTEVWKDELAKIEKIPDEEIQNVLRISYDGLDSNQKSLFLYIACFFKGRDKDLVERRLDACGCYAKSGIDRLIDKSLITISGPSSDDYKMHHLQEELRITTMYDEGDTMPEFLEMLDLLVQMGKDTVEMHDLLEQMGKDIACEECRNDPEKRRILWDYKDIRYVLSGNKGTETIEAISLPSYNLYHDRIEVSRTAFERMSKLQLLVLPNDCVRIPESLDSLPSSLRVLSWESYPLNSLPSNFSANNLVELEMHGSRIEHLWGGVQPQLMNLKILNLSSSKHLVRSMDFSNAPNLEVIDLSDCTSLVEVSSSIRNCGKLTSLNLSGCEKIERFPDVPWNIKRLLLDGTAIEQVPSSIRHLSHLDQLSMAHNKRLEGLPSNIGQLKCLEKLDLSGCSKLASLPDSICSLFQLTELRLSGCTSLESLPSNIDQLKYLKDFTLSACSKLMSLPSSICNLESLLELCLHGCVNLNGLPNNLGNFKSLESLVICSSSWGCPSKHVYKKMELPGLNGLRYCGITEIPDSLGALVSLRRLCLSGTNIESIPATIKQLPKLVYLDLRDCERLQCLPELPLSLEELDASNCTSLRSVAGSDQFRERRGLIKFNFSNCLNLVQSKIMAVVLEDRVLRVCIPGSEVPEWFSHKETGSSLTVKPHGEDCKILGWAFCIVTRFDSFKGGMVHCRFLGKEWNECSTFWRPKDSYPTSEHVLVWNTGEYSGAIKKATFYYEPFGFTGKVKKVIKCGVHPIFDHHGNEVEEPHPKRLKVIGPFAN